MADSNVDRILKSISSSKANAQISGLYSEVGESMKEVGTPSNNMLLSVICGETRRGADEMLHLSNRVSKLEVQLSTICDLLKAQNIILASMKMDSSDQVFASSVSRDQPKGGDWFYQGTRLSSRYHVYACILCHLIDMVQLHMDRKGIQYQDSVDCDFKTMHNCVRIVSTERCNRSDVEYKNTISTKDKDDQAFNTVYPIISSRDKNLSTTMPESRLVDLWNPVTRPMMQDIEWIRQRLCFTEGILSIKQIDILKSIKYPVIKAEFPDELNWSIDLIKPRYSHPLVADIADLPKNHRDEYIKYRMKGNSVPESYTKAKAYTSTKK